MPAEIKMDGFNMNKKNIIIIILALVAMNVSFTCKATGYYLATHGLRTGNG